MIPAFDKAEQDSWKAHSHEWLIAFSDFVTAVEKIAEGISELNKNTEDIGTEIFNSRKQWERFHREKMDGKEPERKIKW